MPGEHFAEFHSWSCICFEHLLANPVPMELGALQRRCLLAHQISRYKLFIISICRRMYKFFSSHSHFVN